MNAPSMCLLAIVFAGTALAQDLVPKAPPQKAPVVLENAVLHTVTGGIVLGGTLWFHDGTIRGVLPAGAELQLPDGVQPVVHDLKGKHVFPGLISAQTSLGLIEIGMVRQTVDTDEHWVWNVTTSAPPTVACDPTTLAA